LHLHVIRKQLLLNYDKLDALNLFAHRYKHGMNNLDIYEIRQSLGEYFLVAVKRDTFEFLAALRIKYNYIQNLVDQQVIAIY